MGTIISKTSLDRITNYINEAEKMGAKFYLMAGKLQGLLIIVLDIGLDQQYWTTLILNGNVLLKKYLAQY